MSTIEQQQPVTLPALIAGQALSQEEFHRRYEAMPPETRAELVGGVVYVPSPIRSEHSESSPDVIICVFHGLCLDPEALLAGDLDALITTLDHGLASTEHEAFVARLNTARAGADVSR